MSLTLRSSLLTSIAIAGCCAPTSKSDRLAVSGSAVAQENEPRGYLGAELVIYRHTVGDESRRGKGFYVNRVLVDSPASQYGLMRGDVIISINGRSLEAEDEESLLLGIERLEPGSIIVLTLSRWSDQRTIFANPSTLPSAWEPYGDKLREIRVILGKRSSSLPDRIVM